MASKNKFQGTYRVGMKVPDERVNRLKADVDKFGSFPQFVDALYDAYLAGEIQPVEPTDDSSAGTCVPGSAVPAVDEQKLLDAIDSAKQAVLTAISQHAREIVESIPASQAPVQIPSAPAPMPSPAVDKTVLEAHRNDIIEQVLAAHKVELSRLDDMLAEIRNISANTVTRVAEAPEMNEPPVPMAAAAPVAAPSSAPVPAPSPTPSPVLATIEDKTSQSASPEPLSAPVDYEDEEEPTMTQEETSSFVDELIGWVSDKDVEAKSDLDMLELVKAKNDADVSTFDSLPSSDKSRQATADSLLALAFDDSEPEPLDSFYEDMESSMLPASDEVSSSFIIDDDDEYSMITEADLDDDIIAGLAAIWGD